MKDLFAPHNGRDQNRDKLKTFKVLQFSDIPLSNLATQSYELWYVLFKSLLQAVPGLSDIMCHLPENPVTKL